MNGVALYTDQDCMQADFQVLIFMHEWLKIMKFRALKKQLYGTLAKLNLHVPSDISSGLWEGPVSMETSSSIEISSGLHVSEEIGWPEITTPHHVLSNSYHTHTLTHTHTHSLMCLKGLVMPRTSQNRSVWGFPPPTFSTSACACNYNYEVWSHTISACIGHA